jgi:hypothetical protein
MTNTKKNYKELENEATRGRKRYLERVQEDMEAKEEQRQELLELARQKENNYNDFRQE